MNMKVAHELYEAALDHLRHADDSEDGVRRAREALNDHAIERYGTRQKANSVKRGVMYPREIAWAWKEALR